MRIHVVSPHVAIWAIAIAYLNCAPASAVDYMREVRPILAAKCFSCHGPDEAAREAELRIDHPDSATEDRGGYAAIVTGKPDDSEVIARIESTDESMRMPPLDSAKALSAEEIDLLRDWVAEGAVYEEHWAFQPVRAPDLPHTAHSRSNPIDRFIRARLAREGIEPAPRADAYTLVRRLCLDLTGLPPSLEMADEFASDPSEEAYQRLVDRLLASPHYGERWARRWLDLARYSDTKGYEKDQPRTMWPYRDWVIDAINEDMPFDQFTIEQIAGDMLPDPTLDQLVATGFHRNTMTNEEGGIDPQEYRFLAVVDRVATTGTTWLGLTLGCAQCHTHKYDPITHTDFYGMFALLNNADDVETDMPSPASEAERRGIEQRIAAILDDLPSLYEQSARRDAPEPTLREAVGRWADTVSKEAPIWTSIAPDAVETDLPTTVTLRDGSVLVSGDVTNSDCYVVTLSPSTRHVAALRIEALPDASLPGGGSGRRTIAEANGDGKGSFLLTEITLEVVREGEVREVPLSRAHASFAPEGIDAGMAIDGRHDTGWTGHGRQRERQALAVAPAAPLDLAPGDKLRVTLRHDSFYPAGLGRFRVAVASQGDPSIGLTLDDEVMAAIQVDAAARTPEEWSLITQAFLLQSPDLVEQQNELHELRNRRVDQPAALTMRERRSDPRATHRRHRGEYLKPREIVEPATPAFLPGLEPAATPDRSALARWLVSPDNPLTARVFVNRQWEALFGVGLVKTSADFGMQSEYPTHPELLDWLANQFVRSGWSRNQLHRLIVTSETYKQSSYNPAAAERDPENRLLARAPRLRLEAEAIRDVVLASSGLLSNKIGGPSVFPPQPAGITEAAYGPLQWIVSTGEERYRRGIYTFNKRTAPYAAFGLFDAPSGEVCVARRDRSTTPLQSLTMLNDEVVGEAARAMAVDVVRNIDSDAKRATRVLRQCVTRQPIPSETEAVVKFVDAQRRRLAAGELDPLRVLGAGPTLVWDFSGGAAGWTPRHDVKFEPSDGALVVRSTGDDPYLGIEFDAPPGPYVMEIEATLTPPGPLEVFWTTQDSPAETAEQSAVAEASSAKRKSYRFSIETTTPLRSLRIDPGRGPGETRLYRVRLAYGDGLFELAPEDDPVELATWKLAARALLNLDEVITRP